MYYLDNWSYSDTVGNLYCAPENQTIVLIGMRYKDNGKVKEKRVQTSELVSIVEDALGNFLVHTFTGSVYRLGKPLEGWTAKGLLESHAMVAKCRKASGFPLGKRP